jgi:hypothetical protein
MVWACSEDEGHKNCTLNFGCRCFLKDRERHETDNINVEFRVNGRWMEERVHLQVLILSV